MSAIVPLRRGLLVLAMVLLAWPSAAQNETFRVGDIPVRAEAADAVQAQAIAIERGQREGLNRLLQRLASGSGQAVPSLQGESIDRFVASFEVEQETVGPGSYAGTIAVTYDREAVEGLLRDRGIGFVRQPAATAVVVPLWETGSGLKLWERDNAWKEAVDRNVDDGSLARLVVPLGDLQDIALLDANQAARGDADAMDRLAARYGADSAILARLQGSGEPGEPLTLEARRYGGAAAPAYRSVVRRGDDEPLEASLARAVREMQANLEQRVREMATVPAGPRQTMVVIAPVEDLAAWGRLLAEIEGLAEVERTSVRRLTRREATLDLEVAGGIDRLRQSLGRFGWNLIDDENDRWRLQRGGQPAGTPPS